MFEPNLRFSKFTDITPAALIDCGVKGVLLDIDNTISYFKGERLFDGVTDTLSKLSSGGISVVIFSNGKYDRIEKFVNDNSLNCEFIAPALKPLTFKTDAAKKLLGLNKSEIAVVGDQVFTDMAFAAFSGLKKIYVEPTLLETSAFFKFKRSLEKIIKKGWKGAK
ncbi:MAG: YqeG family HAD IIIA-type phosphatase [Oscillospiraceae bacterium]|nr:YqeG family HAD IIIA-type phosphatase [Candidatus Equicaccousia limihippi]